MSKELMQITTPLKWAAWEAMLADHPDREYVAYLRQGIQQGFRIGYNYEQHRCTPAKRNMLSAREHPEVIDDYLAEEMVQGRMVEVSDVSGLMDLQLSPFGIIPKRNTPGKWRLIVDLSSPEGESVNDGIDKQLCSLSYVSVDDVAREVVRKGRGAQLAKMDIKHAYRLIPVHPDDRKLLGVKWNGKLFLDKVLPFGLRSAPKIFTAVADALEWVLKKKGVAVVYHYLDDFVTVGDPGTSECATNLQIILEICKMLGVIVAVEKCEGPAVCLVFLGIEIDSERMEMRLPADKLERLQAMLREWRGRKVCTKRELLSLVGLLSHACKVVKPGRIFLSQMIKLSTVAKQMEHRIRLNRAFRSDLEWWYAFVSKWNGVSMLWEATVDSPDIIVTSDASGSWGCGAFWQEHWFQLQWSSTMPAVHIMVKELIPIVIACATWGQQWAKKSILARTDNSAVVALINSGYSRDTESMHLMRCLHFIMARFQFHLMAEHLPGSKNLAADALSRNNASSFHLQVPTAAKDSTPISAKLIDLLVHSKPDWMSVDWTNLFSSI